MLAQDFRGDLRARVEAFAECVEIDDFELLPEQVVESALRHSPVQRHLAAFKSALVLEPRARLRALVSATGLHALPRSLAASDPLLRMRRTLGGTQVTEIHKVV